MAGFPNPLDLIKGGVKDVIDAVGGVVDKVSTTDEERLEAKHKLLEIERSFQAKVIEAESVIVKAQAEVVKAEAESASWLARNWRPLTMLTFTFIILWNYVLCPIFGMQRVEMPEPMWSLLQIGMGGYVIGRSVEKVVPATAEVLAALRKDKN